MKQRRGWAITVGILLCLLTGGSAFGADLTVTVPVKVSNLLPEVGQVFVACRIEAERIIPGSKPALSPIEPTNATGLVIGYSFAPSTWLVVGAPPLVLVNGAATGAVNGAVKVEFTLPESVKTDGTIARFSYVCSLFIYREKTGYGGQGGPDYATEKVNLNWPWTQAKPGTTPVREVTGYFP